MDIGCNTGRYWKGYDVFAIDLNPAAVAIARERGIDAVADDARNLSYCDDDDYGAVVMLDVLEHIENQKQALREAHRVLKDGGLLVLSVPLHPSLWSEHDVQLGHVRRYEQGELRPILESAGFNVLYRSCWNIAGILGARIRKKGFGIRSLAAPAAPLLFFEALAGSIFPLPLGLTEIWVVRKE